MSEGKVTVALLRELPLFAGVPDARLAKVVPLARLEQVEAGTEILRSREPASDVRVVVHGKVRECLECGGTTELCLMTMTRGEVVGWSALIEDASEPASAVALRASTILAIDGEALRDLCEADHDLGFHLMRNLLAEVASRLNDSSLQLLDVYGHG